LIVQMARPASTISVIEFIAPPERPRGPSGAVRGVPEPLQ
jgi:hypothetical protein